MNNSDATSRPRGVNRIVFIAVLAGIGILIIGLLAFNNAQSGEPCPSEDKNVCRAIATWQDTSTYTASVAANLKGITSPSRLEVGKSGELVRYSQFSNSAPYQVVLDGTTGYTRDPKDQKWWKQSFSESEVSTYKKTILPFAGRDPANKNFAYKMLGRQQCPTEDFYCYKFEVTVKDQDQTIYYVWFDVEHFKFRQILHNSGSTSIEYKIKYADFNLNPPTNQWVKGVPSGKKLVLGSSELLAR